MVYRSVVTIRCTHHARGLYGYADVPRSISARYALATDRKEQLQVRVAVLVPDWTVSLICGSRSRVLAPTASYYALYRNVAGAIVSTQAGQATMSSYDVVTPYQFCGSSCTSSSLLCGAIRATPVRSSRVFPVPSTQRPHRGIRNAFPRSY